MEVPMSAITSEKWRLTSLGKSQLCITTKAYFETLLAGNKNSLEALAVLLCLPTVPSPCTICPIPTALGFFMFVETSTWTKGQDKSHPHIPEPAAGPASQGDSYLCSVLGEWTWMEEPKGISFHICVTCHYQTHLCSAEHISKTTLPKRPNTT